MKRKRCARRANRVSIGLFLLTALACSHGYTKQPSSATATLNITVTVPPCELKLPTSIALGQLPNGVTKQDVDIQIVCASFVRTALSAEVVGGTVLGKDSLVMAGTGRAVLRLKERGSNSFIVLDTPTAFCDIDDTVLNKTCRLMTETTVVPSDKRGPVTAAVKLTIRYPT